MPAWTIPACSPWPARWQVDALRFLDRHGARALITALERWVEWDKTHPEKAGKAGK